MAFRRGVRACPDDYTDGRSVVVCHGSFPWVEYSAETFALQLDALRSCFYFMRTLTPDDWTAVVLFDKRLRIIQDFTQDRTVLQNTLQTMVVPLSRELNLFDAPYDTLDRLQSVEGRKYIILLASGVDTFSRKILDEVYRKSSLQRASRFMRLRRTGIRSTVRKPTRCGRLRR
jgi:hypothetical protein